ncbi:MAG TPA: nitroreductase family protein [Candidatus Limnocylindrales bacterium]|nr:nitroreductase family protein [Candidatus Limnocylindrales bacterium]
MSHLLKELKERRSVRKYLARPVLKELIREVLSAAGWAPSAHNAQPWRFIVLVNPRLKRRLAEAMAEAWAADMAKDGVSIYAEKSRLRVERFANAPALVLACLSMEDMAKFPDEERKKCERDLAMQSLAAAIQNMLLAAHGEGLGACWFSAPAFCKETVREVMKIPSEVEPEALIAIGYPAEEPTAPPKKQLSDYCFQDTWGGRLS